MDYEARQTMKTFIIHICADLFFLFITMTLFQGSADIIIMTLFQGSPCRG